MSPVYPSSSAVGSAFRSHVHGIEPATQMGFDWPLGLMYPINTSTSGGKNIFDIEVIIWRWCLQKVSGHQKQSSGVGKAACRMTFLFLSNRAHSPIHLDASCLDGLELSEDRLEGYTELHQASGSFILWNCYKRHSLTTRTSEVSRFYSCRAFPKVIFLLYVFPLVYVTAFL